LPVVLTGSHGSGVGVSRSTAAPHPTSSAAFFSGGGPAISHYAIPAGGAYHDGISGPKSDIGFAMITSAGKFLRQFPLGCESGNRIMAD